MEWGEEDMSPAAPTGVARAARESEVQARRGAGEEGEGLGGGGHVPVTRGRWLLMGRLPTGLALRVSRLLMVSDGREGELGGGGV